MEPISPVSSLPHDLLLRKDPANALRLLGEGGESQTPQKLEEVAKQFEGIFLRQILKEMRSASASLEEDSEDVAADQVQSMIWDFWAQAMTERGGLGLWKLIYQQFADRVADRPAAEAAPALDEQI